MQKLLRAAGLALLGMVQAADAADIHVGSGKEAGFVLIEGRLAAEDINTFRIKTAGLATAIVLLRSHGGNAYAGIEIGRYIRMRNWATAVLSSECASACALIWLGGTRRFVDATAKIGFHAAHVSKGGQVTESGFGNALIGSYLNQLGLSEKAIYFVTGADPRSMHWLTLADAAAFDIELEALPAVPAVSAPPPAPTATPPSLSSAMSPAERRRALDTLAHVEGLFRAWSSTEQYAMTAIAKAYRDSVAYYGSTKSRAEVIADKRKFIDRWPVRRYELDPATIDVTCAERSCLLTATATWSVMNVVKAKNAKGAARIHYRVWWTDNGPEIYEEHGEVLSRDAQPSIR